MARRNKYLVEIKIIRGKVFLEHPVLPVEIIFPRKKLKKYLRIIQRSTLDDITMDDIIILSDIDERLIANEKGH